MLTVVFVVLPATFGLLMWNAYRAHRRREAAGRGFTPRGGAVRWDGEDVE